MSTLNPPKRLSKRHELREDKVVTFYARVWQYFDQNRPLVYGIVAGLVAVALIAVGWVFYQNQQAAEAQSQLSRIVPTYEEGNYQEALDGADGRMGLLALVDEYGGSEAGNQARFYAADALYQVGDYEQALEFFDDYDKGDDFFGAAAYAGMAAIYENQEDYERAADLYRRAALQYENELTSPQYLLSAGRAFEMGGDYDEAVEAYELISERFPESAQASNLDFFLARARARS